MKIQGFDVAVEKDGVEINFVDEKGGKYSVLEVDGIPTAVFFRRGVELFVNYASSDGLLMGSYWKSDLIIRTRTDKKGYRHEGTTSGMKALKIKRGSLISISFKEERPVVEISEG